MTKRTDRVDFPAKRLTPEERFTPPSPTLAGTPPSPTVGLPALPPLAPIEERFVLLSPLGMGGMSLVLLGRDDLLGRQVAVKVLRDDLFDRAAAERRFYREARIHAQLQHAGIAPLYDLGRFPDGRPCIVMKYLHGKTLDELLQEAATTPGGHPCTAFARFLDVFEDVCRTVAYAHGKGVIHRDLKPANVMATDGGQVQVLDWGLAKVIDEPDDPAASLPPDRVAAADPYHTLAGCAIGTPAYAAPEQASGQLWRVDERSDVFGLGAILCEILTGDPPYPGETEVAARQAADGDVREAYARLDRGPWPPALVELCKRCLSPRPEDRPPHAAAVADAVAGYRAAVTDRALRQEAGGLRRLAGWLRAKATG